MERLVRAHPDALPPEAAETFEHLLLQALVDQGFRDAVLARERPLARNAARFVADFERRRRVPRPELHVEQTGELPSRSPGAASP